MTQVFRDNGDVVPVTAILAKPVIVAQVKTKETDGYDAVQIAFNEKRESLIKKPQKGHLKNIGNFSKFQEFRVAEPSSFKVGDKMTVADFNLGDKVTISAVSKGKGFQGVVKRHDFSGGSRTHGQKHSEREPGAIGGAGRAGGRVVKGMRMAGRMGGEKVTMKNLSVEGVFPDESVILVTGALPGPKGTEVKILG